MEIRSTPRARERWLPPLAADRRARLALLLPAAAGFAIVWLATGPFGAGLSPDSVQFLAAAKSLVAGAGLRRVEGAPFVEWAPLLPAWLAGWSAVGIDALFVARVTGALCAGGIAWAAGLWTYRRTGSVLAAHLAATAIGLSYPLLYVGSHLWSDAPFLFFALLGVLALGEARGRDGVAPAARAALPVALACLTRYLGVTLLAAGAVFLLYERKRPWRERVKRKLVYGALSAAPLAVWLARNAILTGTATGSREPPGFTWGTNLLDLAHSVSGPLIPWDWSGTLKLVLCAAAITCVLLLSRRARETGPLGLFAALYAVAVVSVASFWGSDRVDLRFALPVIVAVIAGLVAALSRVRSRVALAAFALVWIGREATVTTRHVALFREQGIPGFGDKRWRSSPTLALLRAHPPAGRLYSNAPEIAYLAIGREVRLSPRAHLFYASGARVDDLELFARTFGQDGPATLIWFPDAGREQLVTIDVLARRVSLRESARASDGVIYRAEPLPR